MAASRSSFGPCNQDLIRGLGAFQIALVSVLLLATLFAGVGAFTLALLGIGMGTGAHVAAHVVGRDLGDSPEAGIRVFAVLAALPVAAGVLSRPTSPGRIRVRQ